MPVDPWPPVPGPPLILVTGQPGTGKTSLAAQLGPRLGLPVLHKDVLKETLFTVFGTGEVDWSRRLGQTSNTLLWCLAEPILAVGAGVILESNFQAEPARLDAEALQARQPFQLLEVRCCCSRSAAMERFWTRVEQGERHRGHLDGQLAEEVERRFVRYPTGPLISSSDFLTVNTQDWSSVDIEAVRTWVLNRATGVAGCAIASGSRRSPATRRVSTCPRWR